MISCKEVFCSELPSPSSIFHSSSNNSYNDATVADGVYYQFASERHSLTLQSTSNAQEDNIPPSKNKRNKNNKGYTLSVERLLPKSKREKHTNIEEPSSSATTTTTTICSAHSSLQRDNISIRAFAIKETITNPTQHHHSSSSNSSQDDQATVDTHFNSLGGTHQSGSGSRSVTTNATSATNTNNTNKEVATITGGDGSNTGGEMMSDNKKHYTSNSGDQGIITSSSKYALMIKYHHFSTEGNKGQIDETTTATKAERINLDFCPISVHVTHLHSSSKKSEDGHIIPIIGVFVSGDDNKLHFFVATMQALKERLFQKEENAEESATTMTVQTTQCFQPTLCFETIDPSNILSTSTSEKNSSEYHNLSSEESSVDDKPLMFETNIMAIDTCVSDSHVEMKKLSSPSSSSSVTNATIEDKVNRLAVACYDGVIRILTYTIECTLDAKNLIRITKLQYSTFIVDGPVATLDFHCSKITKNSRQMSDRGPLLKEEEEHSCDNNNVFLLAGSLCGLAFLFYDGGGPSTASAMEGNSFQGPVVVVDGLYDADKEGFEDCVTVVHVMRYHDVTILAVGTQGCRLILFQRQRNQSTGNNEAIKEHDKQKSSLTTEIENKTEEMMHLSTERDKLTHVVSDLRQKLLEFENNNQEEDMPENNEQVHDDATITPSDSDIGNDGDGDDVNVDPPNEGCISNESTAERLNSIKAEIDDREQSRSEFTSKIAELQSSIDNLTDKLKDLSIPSPPLDPKSVRKLHRYEFLWEHRLPYPIQAIGSSVSNQSDLECFITTRQTTHIFRLLTSQMVDAAAALLERKLSSFSNTTEDCESE